MSNVFERSEFHTTNWEVVRTAADRRSPQRNRAVEEICSRYWYPLYAYLRRKGHRHEEAEDLIQGFFAEGLEKEFLRSVAPEKGRFRTFLLVCLKRHFTAVSRRQFALKRGGGRSTLPIESADAQQRYLLERADGETPEQVYERRWALCLIEHALAELRRQMYRDGKGQIFDVLQDQLIPGPDQTSSRITAIRLGTNKNGVRVALHRFRCRFRDILRSEIAKTLTSPYDLDSEVDCIIRILSR